MDLQNSDVGFERSTFFKPFAEGLEKKCNLVSFFASFPCLVVHPVRGQDFISSAFSIGSAFAQPEFGRRLDA